MHDASAQRPPGPHDPFIRVVGAREHNLRDIDVELPRDTLVAVTGVSGSGKSTLAFGTIFAEAQRRYLESVAPYARRLLHQLPAPRVEHISGLPPAVALQQRGTSPGSRSTVGTITGISSSLRMLFSRTGEYPPGAPRLDSDAFSPNTASGACPACHGLGEVHEATERSLVPDPSLSIRDGAISAWPGAWQGKNLRDILATLGHDVDRPWRELSQEERDWILFTDEQPVVTVHPVREAERIQRPYQGTYMSARRYVMKTLASSRSESRRAAALRHVETSPCPACEGTRLRADALAVTVSGRSIAQLAALPMTEVAGLVGGGEGAAGHASARDDAERLLAADVAARAGTIVDLGLGYLSIDRTAPSLSPGELQRLRIAALLRSGLFGVVYVLDEPSASLHPADAEPLLALLDRLVEAGNTVLVVEHDMDVVRRAGWVVDVGPGAGAGGGELVYSGPVEQLAGVERSVTGRFLDAGSRRRAPREPREPSGTLALRGVRRHNLQGIDVDVPRGVLTAVTGVSGSGKTSLVAELARAAEEGELEGVDRVVSVDQAAIGRTPRSNLATYTGLFDAVRREFAATDLARERGYGPGRFSFNVAGGRCETCEGAGAVSIELLFLPGTWGPCPDCEGARYEPATLEVTWHGMTIADVLELTVDDATGAFAEVAPVARALDALQAVGLGYLHLGQPATTLSGGEAQRIKLASELQRRARGHVLYVLDEPTTGLHPADAELLLAQLERLVDAGAATVVLVEHAMSIAAAADHVIDMGPGGGEHGGRVVAAGTPREVAAEADSRTAPFLARALG